MKIVFSIMYAGLQLPVLKNEQGQDVTPLKPISDLFGLKWEKQREKITQSDYLSRFLGVCTLDSWGAGSQKQGDITPPRGGAGAQKGQKPDTCTPHVGGAGGQIREQTCILISRVAAFLMSINPELVRARGNKDGAKFLEEKQEEWADALHDYEELGVAVNLNHAKSQELLRKQRASFAQMIGVKNKTADAPDRKALGAVVQQMAAELGVAYQPDLTA